MILTKKEREVLVKVKTTKTQARLILKRNQTVLDFLRKWWKTDTRFPVAKTWRLGCPHCQQARHKQVKGSICSRCNWHNVKEDSSVRTFCLDVTFGGICQRDIVDTLELAHDSITLFTDWIGTEEDYECVCRFLKGHIEWARGILRKGKP